MPESFDPSKYSAPKQQEQIKSFDPTKFGTPTGKPIGVGDNTLAGYNFDINVNRYKRFIDNIYPEALEKEAAYSQSSWSKAGNMFMKGVLGEILAQGIIGGIGSLAELPDAIIKEARGKDADFTNFMTKFADDITAELEDRAPIFRYNPGKSFDWRDWGWWTESGTSIFSTLGLLIPALGEAKAAGWIAKGLKKMSAIARLNAGRVVAKPFMIASDLMNTEKYWVGLTHSAFAMRNAENMREGSGIYHTVLGEARESFKDDITFQKVLNSEVGQEFLKEGRGSDKDELAKHIASKAAWKNYGMNAGNVVFDAMQLTPIFKGFKIRTRTSPLLESAKVKTAQKLLLGTTNTTSKAISSSFNAYPFIKGGAVVIGEQSTEGIEELINAISQSDATWYGKYLIGKEKDKDWRVRLDSYLHDPSSWEQAFWGFTGGMAFSGTTHGINKIKNIYKDTVDPLSEQARIDEITNRAKTIGNYSGAIQRVLNGINPNNPTGKFEGTEEEIEKQKESIIDEIKTQMGYNLGFTASKHGNVNHLVDMVSHEDFKTKAIEWGITTESEFDKVATKLKRDILGAEQTFKHVYSKIFTDTTSKPWLRDIIINSAIQSKAHISSLIKQRDENRTKASNLRANSPEFTSLKDKNKDKEFDKTLDNLIINAAIKQLEDEVDTYADNTVKNVLSSAIIGLKQELRENHKLIEDKQAEGDFNVISDIITAEALAKITDIYLSANNALHEEIVNTKTGVPQAEREFKEAVTAVTNEQMINFRSKLFTETEVKKEDTNETIQQKIDNVNTKIEAFNKTKEDPYAETSSPTKKLNKKEYVDSYLEILNNRLKYLTQEKTKYSSREAAQKRFDETNDAIVNSLQSLFNKLGLKHTVKFSGKPVDDVAKQISTEIKAYMDKKTGNPYSLLNKLINDPEYVEENLQKDTLQVLYDRLASNLPSNINNALRTNTYDVWMDALLRNLGYKDIAYSEITKSDDINKTMNEFKSSLTEDSNIKPVIDFNSINPLNRDQVDLANKLMTRIINSGTPLFDETKPTVTLWFKQIAARYAQLTSLDKLKEDIEFLKAAYRIIREAKVNPESGSKYRYNQLSYIKDITAEDIIEQFNLTQENYEYINDNEDYLNRTGGISSTNTFVFESNFTFTSDENGNLIVNDKDRDRFSALMNGIEENTPATVQVNSEYSTLQEQDKNKTNSEKVPLLVTVVHNGKTIKLSSINHANQAHDGVQYKYDGKDWTDVILDDIGKTNTKAEHIINLLPQLQNWYNLQRINAKQELIDEAYEQLLNDDSFGIINELLGNLKPRTKEGRNALIHISKVIFYGNNTANSNEIASNKYNVIKNIRNWKSKIYRDEIGIRKIRNTIKADPTKTISTKITHVTSGALAKTRNGKLNKLTIVGKTKDIKLFITPKKDTKTVVSTTDSSIKIDKQGGGDYSHSVFLGVPTPRNKNASHLVVPIRLNKINGGLLNKKGDENFVDRLFDLLEDLGTLRIDRRTTYSTGNEVEKEQLGKQINELEHKLSSVVQIDFSFKGNEQAIVSTNKDIRIFADDKFYVYDYYNNKFYYERETPDGLATKDISPEEFKDKLGQLNRNVNYAFLSNGEFGGKYTSITGESYNSYEEYLIETGTILTDVTQVHDKKGNNLGNFIPNNSDTNVKLAINIDTSQLSIGKSNNANFIKFQNEFNLDKRYSFVFTLFNSLMQETHPISKEDMDKMIRDKQIEEDCTGKAFGTKIKIIKK